MMASSLALHLPHAPIVSQPLAQVAMPPASAPALFVASAVRHSLQALVFDILWQSGVWLVRAPQLACLFA